MEMDDLKRLAGRKNISQGLIYIDEFIAKVEEKSVDWKHDLTLALRKVSLIWLGNESNKLNIPDENSINNT